MRNARSLGHGLESSLGARGVPTAAVDLRDVVEKACADDLLPPALRASTRGLCDDVDEGRVSVDAARDEIRSLLAGLALRARAVGQQCCELADLLVAELTGAAGVRWDGVTVPGAEDRSNARTGLIELRFPATDFWAIPAAVHEVGHVLARAPQLGATGGANNAARRIIDAMEPAAQREELFCDFYATYVLGPAFPEFMIVDELDSTLAAPQRPFPDLDEHRAVDSHPTPDKRVFVMMNTLARMNVAAGSFNRPYAFELKMLESIWHERMADDPAGCPPHAETEPVLTHFVGQLWHQVAPRLGGAFAPSMAARSLVDDLAGKDFASDVVPSSGGVRVLDVVAAAWTARIKAKTADRARLDGIKRRAVTVVERVIRDRLNERSSW